MIPSKEHSSGSEQRDEGSGCGMPFTWLRNYFGIDAIERCDSLDERKRKLELDEDELPENIYWFFQLPEWGEGGEWEGVTMGLQGDQQATHEI